MEEGLSVVPGIDADLAFEQVSTLKALVDLCCRDVRRIHRFQRGLLRWS